uniref:Kinesin-like protein n=1 Tax=Spongospora subterranea TaxID=70186 RepID=A0A0H5QKI7_9EUKA|eukprot:CRZ02523.1 hypothetical protein [Spongospora subterranea]
MVKTAIQVFVRTRPIADFAHDAIKIDPKAGSVSIHMDKNGGTPNTGLNNLLQDWTFRVNRVLHCESQEATFDICCRDMVMATLNGYNGTLMAYGQTGAGKSFTMGNGTYDYKYRGISSRAISLIFRAIASRPENEIVTRVSYMEIYNEMLRDLLCEESRDLSVREDSSGNVSVKGLKKPEVTNEEQALNLLFEGESNRSMGQHANNTSSSRSHTIFTIYLETRSRIESAEKVIVSKLNLVDLAGSERVAKTDSRGQTLQEALYINRSLSFLEQVVIALSSRHRDHIPFRSSKLTHVLRDSLGGNSITRLIANVWPAARHLEETISTLKFATRMMRLTTDATINIDLDPTLLLKKYEKQIALLKQELAMHDMISNRGPVSHEDFTPEQQKQIHEQVLQYLALTIPELPIVSLQQVHEIFRQFKIICKQHSVPAEGTSLGSSTDAASASLKTTPNPTTMSSKSSAGPTLVGELVENLSGFSVGGSAPSDARPVIEEDDMMSRAASPDRRTVKTPNPIPVQTAAANVPVLLDEETAFQEWRSSEGASPNAEYSDLTAKIREAREQYKVAGTVVNAAKREIDTLSARLAELRAERTAVSPESLSNEEIIDEEEYTMIRDIKQRKTEYQNAFERWKSVRDELSLLKENCQLIKKRMASQFLQWFEQRRASDSIDILDDGEQFEKIEADRILNSDPESLSYYNAKKTLIRNAYKRKGNKRIMANMARVKGLS